METTENQIVQAILKGQKTIEINGKAVELPSPQTAGTEYQKKFYAELKAREILASN